MKIHVKTLLFAVISVCAVYLWWWISANSEVEELAGHGFVLTLEYTGQFAAGLRGIRNQQCWISSFGLPLVIVEPFVANTTLHNSYKLWNQYLLNRKSVPFHSIVDIDSFNRNLSHKPTLVSWQNFEKFAPRKVILVNIGSIHRRGCLQFTEEMCKLDSRRRDIQTSCTPSNQLRDISISLQKHNFEVVHSVCIDCQESLTGLTPSFVTEQIFGPHDPHDVTVIINKWKFSFALTKDCMRTCIAQSEVKLDTIHESLHVRNDAEWYNNHYLSGQQYVSILIRLEWYLIAYKREKIEFSTHCFMEVLKAFSQLQQDMGSSYHPFLTTDIGDYGSKSFDVTLKKNKISRRVYEDILNHTRMFVKDLYSNSWEFDDWEKSFVSIPEVHGNKGYIAAVQRSIASRGNCLIMMGGGHFQHMILQAYLQLHPNRTTQCVKLICMAPPFLRMFKNTISSTQ